MEMKATSSLLSFNMLHFQYDSCNKNYFFSYRVDTPQHRLVVHELKGAWTSSNRDVAFALLDSFVKVQQLKKNLSTEALKSFFSKHDAPAGSPHKKNTNGDAKKARPAEVTSPTTQVVFTNYNDYILIVLHY